ncbi:hypothetical protein PFISCL1PPCAC_24301, partial [Pristionchus fissidentatus]
IMSSLLNLGLCLIMFCSSTIADPWSKKKLVRPNVQGSSDEVNRFTRIKGNRPNNIIEKEKIAVPTNFTMRPPCCSDSITSVLCKKMQSSDAQGFAQRCMQDADFSLVQCCSSCGMAQVDQRYKHFFGLGEQSLHCFDRHSTDFCERLRAGSGFWQNTRWSCDGNSTPLAFRICRKTCGYCNADIFQTPSGKFAPKPCGRKAEFVPGY